jgi:hypothetical protein
MSSRSERYLANADKCQQCADVAYTSGTKRLYGVMASQWRQLAEEADWTDQIGSPPLLEKIRHADVNDCRQNHNPNQQHAHTLETAALLEKIDKAESPIRNLELLLKAIAEPQTPKEHQQLAHQ